MKKEWWIALLLLTFAAGVAAGYRYKDKNRTVEIVSAGPFRKAVPLLRKGDTVQWFLADATTPIKVSFPFQSPCKNIDGDTLTDTCEINTEGSYKYDCDSGACSDPEFPVGDRYTRLPGKTHVGADSPVSDIAIACKSQNAVAQKATVHPGDQFSWLVQGDNANPNNRTSWTVSFTGATYPCGSPTVKSSDASPVCKVPQGITAAVSYPYTLTIDKCTTDGNITNLGVAVP